MSDKSCLNCEHIKTCDIPADRYRVNPTMIVTYHPKGLARDEYRWCDRHEPNTNKE